MAIYQHHKSYQMRLLKKGGGLITWFENLDPAMPEATTTTSLYCGTGKFYLLELLCVDFSSFQMKMQFFEIKNILVIENRSIGDEARELGLYTKNLHSFILITRIGEADANHRKPDTV